MNVFDLLAKITLDTTEYDHGLDLIKKGASTVGKIGAAALGAATSAVGAFGVASIKTGMGFDSAMAQVAATMGKTTDQMLSETSSVELSWGTFTGNLRDYAQEMGANTVFSATQAAEALNYMALAGYSTQKSMETLPSVMNLASAGAMNLASASDMVTDTETALGLEAERTTKLIDEMAKTASTTNTSVSQLGSAILTIGGTAKQLNGGMVELADGTQLAYDGTTELSVALGILADNGTKGSAAGTTLRNVLSSISGAKFAKSFGELGVQAYDSEGKLRSLKDILADMNTVMEGMTDQEKTNLINSTFNARDLKNINALLATTDDRWGELVSGLNEAGEAGVMYAGHLYTMEEAQKKFGDAIYDTEQGYKVLGAAEMMAFQQMDNLDGDLTLFRSALEGAQIALSDKITPSLREFVKLGSEGLGEFTEKFKSGDVEGAIGSLGETIGQLASTAISYVPDMIEAGATLLGGIGQGIAEAAGTLFEEVDLGAVVTDMILPMMVGMSEAIREQASSLSEVAVELLAGLGTGITENSAVLFEPIATILTNLGSIVMENAPILFGTVTSIISTIGSYIGQNLPNILSNILPFITTLSETIRSGASTLVDVGIEFILNLAQGIMNSLPTLLAQLPQIVINIAGVINDNAPKLLVAGVKLIAMIIKGIVDSIPALVANFPKIFEAILAVWSALNWMSLGKNVINFIRNGIKTLATQIPNTVKSIGESAVNFFKNIQWTDAGIRAMELIKEAISSLASDIPNKLIEIGNSAVSAFKGIDWFDLGANVIRGIVNGISSNVRAIADAAREAARNALNAAKNFLGIQSPSKVFRREVGEMIPRGMALGIEDTADKVDEAISKLNRDMFKGLDRTVEYSPTIETVTNGTFKPEASRNITNTFNISVDGTESPEAYANRLVRELELQMRTA